MNNSCRYWHVHVDVISTWQTQCPMMLVDCPFVSHVSAQEIDFSRPACPSLCYWTCLIACITQPPNGTATMYIAMGNNINVTIIIHLMISHGHVTIDV